MTSAIGGIPETRRTAWTRTGLRAVLGVVTLGAGVGKALDLAGFAAVLDTYRVLPPAAQLPLAVAVAAVEIALGLWTLAGFRLREAALLLVASNAGYGAWLSIALARGLEIPNCGCFGVFLARPLRWYSPLEDVVLVLLSGLLWRLAPRGPARGAGPAATIAMLGVFAAASSPAGAEPPAGDFRPWFEEDGIAVEIARVPEGAPWIRATATIDAPPAAVATHLADFARYRATFDPVLKAVTVLGPLSEGEGARLHLVWPYPWPLRPRDAVVAYSWTRDPSGDRATLRWRNDARSDDPPGVGVRIERVEGETRIEPDGPGRTRIVYTFLGELGGRFGKSSSERAWRGQPLHYVRSLRRAVRRE